MPLTLEQFLLFTQPIKKSISLEVKNDISKIDFIKRNIRKLPAKLGSEFEKTRSLGSQIKSLSKRKEFKKVKFGTLDTYGRLRPIYNTDKALVDVTRPVRQFLVRGFATDIDIENCHLAIIQELYTYYKGKPLADLKYWNDNRESIFQTIISNSTLSITRDNAKTLGYTFLYQGSVDKAFTTLGLDRSNPDILPIYDLVDRLTKSCIMLTNQIKQDFPEMWSRLPYDDNKPDNRVDAGKISTFCQNIERLCATEIYHAATDLGFHVIDFCHDGLLVSGSTWDVLDNDEITSLCNLSMKKIYDYLGLPLTVVHKEMNHPKTTELERWYLGQNSLTTLPNTHLEIPDSPFCNVDDFHSITDLDPETNSSTQLELNAKLEYINNYVSYITSTNCFFVRNNNDSWIPHRKSDLLTAFENYSYLNKNGEKTPFMPYWLRSQDRSTYIKAEWIPWTVTPPPIPPDTLNIFIKLKHQYDPTLEINMDLVQPWINHIHIVWCSGDSKVSNYVLGWFASIAQHPYDRNLTNLVLKSVKEGAGKNTLTDFLGKHVIGITHYIQSSDIDSLFSKFNGSTERCLLTVMDEVGHNGAAFKLHERLKDITTRSTLTIEHKGLNSYTSTNYNNYIFSSNNDFVMKLSDSDRRNLCIDVSTEKTHDDEYWDQLREVSNDRAGLHFFHYLCRIDLTSYNFRDIPVTEWKRRLQEKTMSPELKVLISLKDTQSVFTRDLMDHYNHLVKDHSKYDNIRAFGNFWCKFTGWQKASRILIDQQQAAGFKLPDGLVLKTIRDIRRDPEYEFETSDIEDLDPHNELLC